MESVISFLSSHYPTIGICIAVAFVVYKATIYHVSIQNTRKKVDELPCYTHKKTIEEQDKKIAGHNHAIREHGDTISDMSVWIMKKDKAMIPVFMNKHSPYYLNPTGLALLDKCGGKRCIDDNIDYFISKLESAAPETPFDVEEGAMKTIMGSKGLPIFNQIKNYIYFQPDIVELGGKEVEISIFAVASVMGIYLRDLYLEKHPEILRKHSSVFA